MPQSLSSVLVHLIFSTKHRQLWISREFEGELYSYLAGIFRGCGSPAIKIDGYDDHIHAVFNISRTSTIADVAEQVKRSSSKWMKTQSPDLSRFQWQSGYAAFSISRSQLPTVTTYIVRQREHHGSRTFKDELRILLEKYEVSYDEKYIWD